MPSEIGRKLRLKGSDKKKRVKGDLTVMVQKDKQNIHLFSNMHHAPAEGSFCDEYGNALKAATVQDCNRLMGYVDKSDPMTNSYSLADGTWQKMKKKFFHLLDLSIFKSFILLTSSGSKFSH
jgi:hypothetical protein